MGTEFAAPFSGTPITTSQQYRDRYRPTQPDMVDDNYGGTGLQCSNSANTAISVAIGQAVVQGGYYSLTGSAQSLAVAANGGGSNRFDIVCLTYDSASSPPIRLRIVQGVAGSGLPALTRSLTGVWDMPLCHYEKQPGGNIVNLVDRRHFTDGSGGIIGANVTYAPLAPQRTGARFTEWATGREYVWNGSSWVLFNQIGGWTAYTPAWTASTTNPTLGNSTINGWYAVLDNKTIAVQAHLIIGSTATFGAGNYRLSTPPGFDANVVSPREQFIMSKCYNGSVAYIGQAVLGTAGYGLLQFQLDSTGFRSSSPTVPFTFASGHHLRMMGVYEYA